MTEKPEDTEQNPTRKPSKQELLSELESIRTSLLPEGPKHVDNNEEPIELTEADMVLESDLSATLEMPIISAEAEENFEFALNIPSGPEDAQIKGQEQDNIALDQTQQASTQPTESLMQNPEKPAHVLPGQQSLFDEDKNQAAENGSATEKKVKATPVKPTASATENPFLPHHIKQKLEKEKSLYQQQINEAVPIQNLASSKSVEPTKNDHETLIDELVDEYLPKIEQELRRRIKAQLSEDDPE